MTLLECMLINNDCFKAGAKLEPRGVMVHSTGANNPNIRRYVQPVGGQENYSELISLLGKNTNGNHWNKHIEDPNKRKCVHAFIGKLADGSIATVQTLPWDMQAWHCAGRCNSTHIAFEICEDSLEDPVYFRAVYKEAVEFTAYLCKLYGLDPLADGVVLCHKEGARRGWASNHSDVENWFPRMGYSMDGFRQDVADLLNDKTVNRPEKEDEDMTGEEIYKKLTEYLLSQKPPAWVAEQGEYAEAVREGITDGSDPTRLTTRYESAIMNLRVLKKARSE